MISYKSENYAKNGRLSGPMKCYENIWALRAARLLDFFVIYISSLYAINTLYYTQGLLKRTIFSLL